MEREELPVDILFVGAGPANLAAAYRLAQSLKEQGKRDEVEIAVIEKANSVGGHILSGAVMDPRAISELFPEGWREAGCPVEAEVGKEAVYHLTSKGSYRIPVPPMLKNHGYSVVTLSDLVVWLKDKLEELEVMVFEGFPGHEFLYDDEGRVAGVRTIDKGLKKDGEPGPNFEPGADITARCVVLGEGSRGSLTKQLVEKFGLNGRNPQIYGTGCKEVWRLPEGRMEPGQVIHTSGWPLNSREYGGSWIYGMKDNRVSVGFVSALDSGQPWNDPWENFQRWKTHPRIKALLEGGEIVKAGVKTVPEGGYWSRPKSYGDHFLILGDSGSLLNISRLKGIHNAMKSGILAADTLLEAIEKEDFSEATLKGYEDRFQDSWLRQELYRVRNYRAEFKGKNFWIGAFTGGVKYVLGGIGAEFKAVEPDHEDMKKQSAAPPEPEAPSYDGSFLIDKVTQVYHAGSVHEENQPSHLKVADLDICRTRCAEEYGNPCQHFCPANVYEMVPDSERGGERLQINHSNCVHCKTCDIMDPYEIITWEVPSDAGGPKYQGL